MWVELWNVYLGETVDIIILSESIRADLLCWCLSFTGVKECEKGVCNFPKADDHGEKTKRRRKQNVINQAFWIGVGWIGGGGSYLPVPTVV